MDRVFFPLEYATLRRRVETLGEHMCCRDGQL